MQNEEALQTFTYLVNVKELNSQKNYISLMLLLPLKYHDSCNKSDVLSVCFSVWSNTLNCCTCASELKAVLHLKPVWLYSNFTAKEGAGQREKGGMQHRPAKHHIPKEVFQKARACDT